MVPILVVDDDVKLCGILSNYLARHDFQLTVRHDGHQGLEEAHSGRHDLMLLDVSLPGMDGFQVLERLRTFSEMCVMVLSGRSAAADRVHGLRLGADDYLPKPFDAEELLARVQAILRRRPTRDTQMNASTLCPAQRFNIDLGSRTIRYSDTVLNLTDIEFSLLAKFLGSVGTIVTREDLFTSVFARTFHPLDRSLDVYVSRLRRKLQDSTPLLNPIRTIRSVGYLFSNTEPDEISQA